MTSLIRIIGEVAVITASPDFHPLRQIMKISSQLGGLNFTGLVLFDLLAVNGLESNRFASMRFGKSGFDRGSFSAETTVSSSIQKEQDAAARDDQEFLHGSVLSSSELKNFMH